MHLKNKETTNFDIGELVKHKRRKFDNVGIVINVKGITSGYDVQVLWPEGRIANHHSSYLEPI